MIYQSTNTVQECHAGFERLTMVLTSSILGYSNTEGKFILNTGFSNTSIVNLISQIQDDTFQQNVI